MAEKTQKNPQKEEIVRQALGLAAAKGWDNVSLSDIADKAGISLAGLRGYFDDKADILATLGRMIDRRVLESIGKPEEGASPRDTLFDILMERFEALNEYRAGVVAVLDSFKSDPKQAVITCPHLCKSMLWMLEAAGIETGGISGAVKVAGLTGIYAKVLCAWKDDESEDLSKTMAALDRDLQRAEKIADMLGF